MRDVTETVPPIPASPPGAPVREAVVEPAAAALFAGPGELRARCRALDWAGTPLGAVAGWPQSLRTAVALCLASGFPMLVMWGPELVQVYNDAFRSVLQAKHPAGLGQPARECWPELWDMIGPMYQGVLDTGASIFLEDQLFTPERRGEPGVAEEAYFTFSYSAIPDEAHRPAGILATVFETTRHVQSRGQRERAFERANAELRVAAAERERLLVEAERARAEAEGARSEAERAALITSLVTTHLADGVCLMDAEGRLTYMNPAAERILGWREAELRGDVLHDRVHHHRPDGRPFPLAGCPLGQVLTAARPVLGLRDQWIRKDGTFVHVVTACAPVVSDGRIVGAVLSLHDDTERRRVEAERERLLADAEAARTAAEAERERATEARSAAEAANRAKSEFLATMSHELRTPLNAIGGYAELIELGIHGPVTEAQRTALERIQRSQRHLLGLIAGVLDYSRVEAGAVSYRLVDVPVAEAVAEAELLVSPQLRAKGLGYAWSGAAPELRVQADREKLQQILLNLLGNAVKFTDARDGVPGRVEVACTVQRGTDGEGGGAWVRIHVRDTGEGIAADALERVFEPFVQADQRLTRAHAGVGLGLAISRDLARGMGGDLTAESTPGVGSTFTLTLPAVG